MSGRRVSRRAQPHRTGSIWAAMGLTTACALLPGSGFVLAGRRSLGLWVLVPHLLAAAVLGWFAVTRREDVLALVVDPASLLVVSVVLVLLLMVWVTVLATTYEWLRPARLPRWQRIVGTGWVVVVGLVIAVPLAMGARYAFVQRDLVTSVFESDVDSVTRPTITDLETSPWGEDDRVNVLLLGGDGGVHRVGIRTDTVILASMNAETGDTVLFSLPRNLQNVPFPAGTPLAEIYPNGFDGEGDPLEWMLNAVYGQVPELHPHLLGETDNEGADALKMAVSAATGLDVNYYVLVNLRGFREVVDAIGGVTVNINQPIPIGGNTDRGIPPGDYLEPGPDQHLDGFEAMWFARGRYGLDDYDRMERQRCVVNALIDEVNPVTLLRRYEQLAQAGKDLVRTDIPRDLLPAFVELGLRLRGGDVRSVVFQSSKRFDPNDPDYDRMRAVVGRALDDEPDEEEAPPSSATTPPSPSQSSSPGPSPTPEASTPEASTPGATTGGDGVAKRAEDSCAYDPVA